MSSTLAQNAWPPPLAHCGKPLVRPHDERVTIAEISDAPINGYKGTRLLYTALVPMEELDTVMSTVDGLGQDIRTREQPRSFEPNGTHLPTFFMYGMNATKKYESLINHWDNGNKEIILPDNDFLMHFRLFPRLLDDEIAWDDIDLPLTDVVKSTPVSNYDFPKGRSGARITVRRDYLDRYLTYKNCAAVATYYDERFSTGDTEVAALIAAGHHNLKQPGRELWFRKTHDLEYEQLSEVWGTALVLKPTGVSSYRQPTPILTWPDRTEPVNVERQGTFKSMEDAYVRDEVLVAYENKPEYEIHATQGSVEYENRWSVGFTHRVGRNHISLELRKLYEGAPSEVIVHFNKFAVPEAVAKKDQEENGKRNVGERARDFVYAYLAVAQTLSNLSMSLGLNFTQERLCKYDSVNVDDVGWWKLERLRPLGNVIPLGMTNAAFLERCKDIFAVIDDLQTAPLRSMTIGLGLDRSLTKDFKSMKLLSCITQLAGIAVKYGLNLVEDAPTVVDNWSPKTAVPSELDSIFALQVLRVGGAHNTTQEKRQDYLAALAVFGIKERQCSSGWGLAADIVYDRLITDFKALNQLLIDAYSSN